MFRKLLTQQLGNSLLLVDKEAGRTSSDQVQDIVHACRRQGIEVKAGHSGTLDTKVTGLLVIGLGLGTKVLEFMLESEKVYIGELILHHDVSQNQLEQALQKFTGTITQLPPQKSSVKRVYRDRNIYELKILEFSSRRVIMYCSVEKGTYIRKLFHDLGESLGVGAHMGDLQRISVGPFKNPTMISVIRFSELLKNSLSYNPWVAIPNYIKLKKYLIPPQRALGNIPQVQVQSGVDKNMLLGNDLFIPGVQSIDKYAKVGERVLICFRGQGLALGKLVINPYGWKDLKKGMAVKNIKVLGKGG